MELNLNYALIGERIKKYRQLNKMTLDELSVKASISSQHLSKIEGNKTKLSLPCLTNLCNALNITTDTILCDSLPQQASIHLLSDVEKVFSDCSKEEIYLMLSVASSLKQALRVSAHNRQEQ